MIPILKHDYEGVKRYRADQLKSYFRLDAPIAYRIFWDNPNFYATRSLEEWSAYFGFEVELLSNQAPVSIDWIYPGGYSR